MNKNQVIALAIGIIMILSTIGFAFYAVSDKTNSGTPAVTDIPPEQPATEMKFSAAGISAKISELMPAVKIAGQTNEYDIGKIDSSIREIKGVKTIESVFGNTVQKPLNYIATISFEKELSAQTLIQAIEKKGLVSGIDGYSFALVELPKKIVFKSESSDLNISKEYDFSDSLSNAYVGLNSLKGDEIIVNVSATFAGSKLVDYFSVEESNITAEPISGTAMLEAPIKSLEQGLVFSGKAFFSNVPDKNSLDAKLLQISDVNNAEIEIPSIAPKLVVSIPEALSEEKIHDLNVFVNSLGPQNFSFSNEASFEGTIPFDIDKNLLDAKTRLEAELNAMQVQNAVVEESFGVVYGKLFLTKEDSKVPSEQLKQLLEDSFLKEIAIQQYGILELASIFDSNTNATSYSIDSNSVPASVNPGHSIGDKVNAKITYYIVRNKIVYIMAEE